MDKVHSQLLKRVILKFYSPCIASITTTEFFTGPLRARIALSTGQYGKYSPQLKGQYGESTFVILRSQLGGKTILEVYLLEIENVSIMTLVGIFGDI